jgi:phosphate transport system protein
MPITDKGINGIRIRVAAMCELATSMCRDGISALCANDPELANDVVSRDAQVDALEVELEEMCLRFLALQAPKAFELRYVVAVTRMISELERIADHSKSIARQVHEHYCAPILAMLPDFSSLTDLVSGMLNEAVEALFKSDAQKYAELVKKDRAVGEYQRSLNKKLVDIISRDAKNIDGAVAMINVIRRLERIADHAKSITVMIPYITEGTILRNKGKGPNADHDH